MKALESILINARGIPEPLLTEMRRACSRAALDPVVWSGDSSAPELAQAPMLLIAKLPSGTRRIPDELVETITGTYPGLPLLLLCEETLVRPTLSLQDGAVNLLGSPMLPGRIAQRIEALLRDRRRPTHRQDTLQMGVTPFVRPVVCVTDERTRWWTATLSCRGKGGAPIGPMVETRTQIATGITAVIPFPEDPDEHAGLLDVTRIDEVVAVAAEARQDPGKERLLREWLGSRAGVIHLGAGAEEWFIYWPRMAAPLILSSPTRLPRCWDLAHNPPRDGACVRRLAAAGGDLLMALSSPLEAPTAGGESPRVEEMTASGGLVAANLLEGRLRESSSPVAGLVLEVY